MARRKTSTVWVFNGNRARFPSAVFSSRKKAEEWIEGHKLQGTLTEYPVDISVLEYVIEVLGVKISERAASDPGNFNSSYLDHEHY